MKLKYFLITTATLAAAVLLIACNNSADNKTVKSSTPAKGDSCSVKDTSNMDNAVAMKSEIICPKCGHKKLETMPTDVCVIKYNCEKCGTELHPKTGDCCVFCTYGTHKCPSMQ